MIVREKYVSHIAIDIIHIVQETSLCMTTPQGPGESCTVRYPGIGIN